MNYLLEKIVLSCGFLSQAIVKVVKSEHRASGIAFPEFLEEITNTFDYLKLEMSLTCEMILDLLDEVVKGVLKKGYLIKKGAKRKNWNKRWFILKESTLFYYTSREDLTQKVQDVCLHTHTHTHTHTRTHMHTPTCTYLHTCTPMLCVCVVYL